MYGEQILRRIPLLVSLKRRIDGFLFARAYNALLEALLGYQERGDRVSLALCSFQGSPSRSDSDCFNRIEKERAHLLVREEPLIDGTLGEEGLYDKGVTIQMACKVSKPPCPAELLYQFVKEVEPNRILELGTNVGISGSYLASALAITGKDGQLVTCDASPYRQRLARDVHSKLGLENVTYVTGLFKDTLTSTLANLDGLNFAFIDGHHQYQPTLDYFSEIYDKAQPGSVFVFDDIRWSGGMFKAWKKLQRDPRLGVVIDLDSIGIAIGRIGEEPRFVSKRIRIFRHRHNDNTNTADGARQ